VICQQVCSSKCYEYNINTGTRIKLKLHKPTVRLTMHQKSAFNNSINIYNKLPDDLAELVLNKKHLLIQLKKYLTEKPFYSLEEYLNA